jgi:hypothetical protein
MMIHATMATNTVSCFNEPCEGIEPVQKSSIFPVYIQADTEVEEGSVVDGPHLYMSKKTRICRRARSIQV